ncbi:MAG TPA: putative DNA binding domain-containing protein [Candidatus Olsenella avicola]|nr:putative DNA binding domain-containing protein [Candidatus Olsenella avicola]
MENALELPKSETLTVEFKSDLERLSDSEIIDTVVALSNTEGGSLYLGVEDDGTPTGVHPSHSDPTGLAALIANKTVPPVPVRASTISLTPCDEVGTEKVSVVLVEVPMSRAIVSSSDGKIMRRRIKADGSPESAPFYPYEIVTRLSTLGQLDYSAFPVPDSSMDDFDPVELHRLRDILSRSKGGDRALLELSEGELLAALRMTASVEGKPVPTIAGLLIAGRRESIARAVPTHGATFQVLDGTEVRENRDFDQPLLYTIEMIRELFEPWNPKRELEDGLFTWPVPEFDGRAFREALVNAFGHRDYASMGSVRVLVENEGLTVANPGGFIEGITIRNLLTAEPHGRNECLMSALKRIGLAEKTGRGVDRIYEGSLHYGRPLPDYTGSTQTSVRVFIARSAPDTLFMRMIDEERSRTGKPLSLRLLLVLDMLKSQRRLTISALSDQLPFTDAEIRSAVETLVETGLVEAWGSGSSRSYTLSRKVYARFGGGARFVRQSDIDRVRYPELILKLAAQQGGSVTRRDVEELLHVDGKKAYRVIHELVGEDKLKLEGKGRAAAYTLVEK